MVHELDASKRILEDAQVAISRVRFDARTAARFCAIQLWWCWTDGVAVTSEDLFIVLRRLDPRMAESLMDHRAWRANRIVRRGELGLEVK